MANAAVHINLSQNSQEMAIFHTKNVFPFEQFCIVTAKLNFVNFIKKKKKVRHPKVDFAQK